MQGSATLPVELAHRGPLLNPGCSAVASAPVGRRLTVNASAVAVVLLLLLPAQRLGVVLPTAALPIAFADGSGYGPRPAVPSAHVALASVLAADASAGAGIFLLLVSVSAPIG